jgi:hypothetical protein
MNRTLNLFNEKLLFFDDWNQSIPILNQNTVEYKNEANIEFFFNLSFKSIHK